MNDRLQNYRMEAERKSDGIRVRLADRKYTRTRASLLLAPPSIGISVRTGDPLPRPSEPRGSSEIIATPPIVSRQPRVGSAPDPAIHPDSRFRPARSRYPDYPRSRLTSKFHVGRTWRSFRIPGADFGGFSLERRGFELPDFPSWRAGGRKNSIFEDGDEWKRNAYAI